MNDSLTKLLAYIEPIILNIQDNRMEVKALKSVYESIKELIELGQNSYLDILEYYDQDFIIKTIKIKNSNVFNNWISKYETSKYLLKNQNANLKELPQYQEAIQFMETLYTYLCNLYQEISLEYETKSANLEQQELFNKYYILFHKNNIFITDILEFLTFLNLTKISLEEKLDILIFINKCNIKNYITTDDIMLTNNIKLSDISDLLNSNQQFFQENFLDNLNLEKFDLKDLDENSINLRKSYLINKIKILYDSKKYEEIIDYYLHFEKLVGYELELKKQQEVFSDKVDKKLVFLMKDGKSLVRTYLETCDLKYRSCILKNLLDLEQKTELKMPCLYYLDTYFYVKDEFVVKTVYTYLENGYILILGVLNISESLENFLDTNKELLKKAFKNINRKVFDERERDLLLQNIKAEDLIPLIDLNTLDIKMEDKDAR